MNIVRLFTIAKLAQTANTIETFLERGKPLNFKVGESNLRDIMQGATASNFAQLLEEHESLARILEVFASSYAFIPMESISEYREALTSIEESVMTSGFRFDLVCPEIDDAPVFIFPVSRKELVNVTLTANIDPDLQEVFESVEVTEDMSDSKYKRKLISALTDAFGDEISNPLWEGDDLKFHYGKLPFTQFGLPCDSEEEDEE